MVVSVGADALREAANEYFRKAFAEVLKLPSHKIDPAEPLETYGIDSILVMQLTARLRKDFGDLKSTLFFEARTLAGLVTHFLTHQSPDVARVLGLEATTAVPEAVDRAVASTATRESKGEALASSTSEKSEEHGNSIAIIGMSGAFPMAADLAAFWENLKAGRDCITEIPAERWSLDGFYEPDRQKAVCEGRSYTKSGGFVDGFADFDPLFFNISPVEAHAMDPQERLFLEHSWRALEDAGYTRELLERRFQGKVGVFTGITSHAFAHHSPAFWNRPQPLYAVQPLSSAPNRVSYVFNLHGPSMPVDTMCSSSLTALHLACEHLRRGECDLAFAGGVHLNLHPSSYVAMCAKGMLSPGGQCRSFGQGADGFVPGEGVGVLVLKPLLRALADGDPIHAVIRGTHVNHGGKTNGYTVPNPQAQQELVAEALHRAGTPPATIGCLEAHGTGTELGDPIEVAALTRAFGRATNAQTHCALGSVKSNIGHAEAAAGIAGVMKVILQLQHRTLVPTLHAAELNPEIDFNGSPFFLPRTTTPWEILPGFEAIPRRAGVSSFGAGGSNAHVVLEEALSEAAASVEESGPFLVLLSARNPEALVQSARNLLDYASRIADASTPDRAHLAAVAYTLQVGREAMEERVALLVESWVDLQGKLTQFIASGRALEGVECGSISSEKDALQWLVGDDDLQAGVNALLAKRKWPKLLALWVKGVRLDWEKLYAPGAPRPRRVSLPTYPFARRRYWLPDEAAISHRPGAEALPKRPADPVSVVNELAYLSRWQVQAHPARQRSAPSFGTVLLVVAEVDPGFLEEGLKQLSGLGAKRVVQLRWSERTEQIATDHWCCNPEDEAALRSVIPEPGLFDCVVFLGGGLAAGEQLDVPALQSRNEVALFRLLKWFQPGMGDRRVDFFTVTTDIFRVLEPGPSAIAGAGLIGLSCSLAQGDRRFRVRTVDLSSRELRDSGTHATLWRQLLSLPASDRGSVVKLEGDALYQWSFLPLKVGGAPAHGVHVPSAFREGGVYLIVGGAGTVGEIITRRLLERYRARVVWVGRSSPASPHVIRKLESMGRHGGGPSYFQADVTDRESMQRVIREVKARFGVIHGAVFSAVVANEHNSIEIATEAEFRSILEAKTRGSVVFQESLGRECTDFLCHFSSIQAFSFTSSRESAGYAAGITFADAVQRSIRCAVPVGAIQWGYWRAFVEGTPFADKLKGRFGLIDDEEGFVFFEWFIGQLRAGALTELICVRASDEVRALMQPSVSPAAAALCDSGRPSVFDELSVERASQEIQASLLRQGQAEPFEKVLQRRLAAQLKRVPGFNPLSPSARPTGIAEKQMRWWDECMAGVAADGAGTLAPLDSEEEWSLACARFATDPSLAARIPLVDECLRQLPEILTGRISPAEILFPRGSMERVEGVYQGNPVADFFNDQVAEVVRSFVEGRQSREPGRTIRILEIGAGTGGTTARVLRQVRADGRNVDYHYTDLSKAFLLFAEEKYAPGNPGLSTRLFNAELPLAEQNIEPGSYDLVLATNVLHATRDMRRTVRNAKALLSRHGILILNEVTQKTWFQFLTFGLLEGWWLFEDPALRVVGSPVLDTASWLRILQEEGFRVKHGPAGSDQSLGQHVFIGESDGFIRQPCRTAGTDSPVRPVVPSVPLRMKPETASANLLPDEVEAVQQAIAKALCDTLRLLPSDIRPDVAFADYGIDSILTETLLNRLNAALGVTLNASVLYDHSSVSRLARHLVAEFGSRLQIPQLAGAAPSVTPPAPASPRPDAAEWSEPAPAAGKPVPPRTLDIAIIGMSGQFPGAADVDTFWRNLVEGAEVIRELPAHYLPPELVSVGEKRKGRAYCNRGGILEDRDCFDPLFFKISPREAESMNPHQRLVLQEGWRALEDAGIDPKSLADRPVGVFVGAEAAGYWHETLSGYSDAIVASRLSYSLNLTGPAFAVNTGCSSSGVALHLACRSLRDGESSLALAGGVFAVMNPQLLVSMAQIEMLSRSGTCSTFDQSADGTVLSEGVGMLVLKRLEDAVADGDPIYGVILGTGINQDGASNGITAPNGAAQEKLIGEVYNRYGIDAAGISYVEAHGTGTKLGDPVEGNALVRAFRRFTPAQRFCTIGSAKSNIGHTAAGAAAIGLIKILLSMRERTLPGLLHFKGLNPMIELADSAFIIGDRTRPWHSPENGPRIAALNSFGHGGTNAHLVVREHPVAIPEEAPSVQWRGRSPGAGNPLLIPLSARTDEALTAAIVKLATHLRTAATKPNTAPLRLEEIAWTLQSGREGMERRCVFIAGDVATLLGQLDSVGLTPAAVIGGSGADSQLLEIARRWASGASLDWRALYGDKVPARLHLPTYVFVRERYWKAPAAPAMSKETTAGDTKAWPFVETAPTFTIPIPLLGTEAYLADHVIDGQKVMPAAALLEFVRAAVAESAGGHDAAFLTLTMEQVVWLRPLVVAGDVPQV
ncbi:MAG TPA: SDR family NAD(P)-dependent oxidoreductase, partial [Candidatus Limnocylindria bacterium]|nr:SDR family NAD(P)-dependent oxidoreductase [Candidatus Limnocylindria bacterium]